MNPEAHRKVCLDDDRNHPDHGRNCSRNVSRNFSLGFDLMQNSGIGGMKRPTAWLSGQHAGGGVHGRRRHLETAHAGGCGFDSWPTLMLGRLLIDFSVIRMIMIRLRGA